MSEQGTSHLLPTYARVDLAFERGEGAWLVATNGERYLDFTSGVAVNALDPGWLRTDLGGPKAPGVAEDGAEGLLATLALPFEQTGKFFKAGVEIPW